MANTVVERFYKATAAGLADGGLTVIPSTETESVRLATVGACLTAACLKQLAMALKGAYLIIARVLRNGKNYLVLDEVTDPQGQVALQERLTCDICTMSEAVKKARATGKQTAIALLRKLAPPRLPPRRPPPKRLPPRRPPPRERVPPRRPPPERRPPPRQVVAQKPAKPHKKPKRNLYWPRIQQAAWMSGVGGVLGFSVGVALLALDKKPTCKLPAPEITCPYRYKTKVAGAVFTATGLAAMAASAVLFYWYYKKRRPRERPRVKLGIGPGPDGVRAHVSVRW